MRARVGWMGGVAVVGAGAGGLAAPAGLHSGPLGLLWLCLVIGAAGLVLVTGSPAVRGRAIGQHRSFERRSHPPLARPGRHRRGPHSAGQAVVKGSVPGV
jgi:hypothetical protein